MPPDLPARLDAVRRRIQAAAHRAHRPPADITLIAVSKTFEAALVRTAAQTGQVAFGENRVQEAAAKQADLSDLTLEWHLIGHLQANKARKAAAAFDVIHSVDSLDLVGRLDSACRDLGVRRRILIQADLAGEATKHGAAAAELAPLAAAALEAQHLDLVGLMLIPPVPETPEASRLWFRRLRDERDALVAAGIPSAALRQLSMGMSNDFEIAIEEGATMVRVGTAIFGERP
jgi:pyridoxal phosphate enzyme (YggS family)